MAQRPAFFFTVFVVKSYNLLYPTPFNHSPTEDSLEDAFALYSLESWTEEVRYVSGQ